MCGTTVIDAWLHLLHDVPAVRVMAGVRRLAVPPLGAPPGCPGWCSRHTGTCSAAGAAVRPPPPARRRRVHAPPAATRTGRTTGAGTPRTGRVGGRTGRRTDPGPGGTGRRSPGAPPGHGRPTCWRICTALSESEPRTTRSGALTARSLEDRGHVVDRDTQVEAVLHRQSDRRAHRPRWAEDGIDPRTPVTEVGAAVVVDHAPGRWNYSRCDVTVAAGPRNCVRG